MRFKLDENLGKSVHILFVAAGHDTHTVVGESLSGAADKQIYEQCVVEQRCLVTLDLDFSNPMRFNPEPCGIVVIRRPKGYSAAGLADKVGRLLAAIGESEPRGKLWIVDENRIRVHQSRSEE